MKLACIIFDALDIEFARNYGLKNICDLYMKRNSEILTCSTYPHTQSSNIMIFSGQLRNWFWIRNKGNGWVDPARKFNRTPEKQDAFVKDDDIELITKKEFDFPFIWNILSKNGYKARALQLPITLPPLSFNTNEETKDWFPYWEDGLYNNLRDKERITMDSLKDMVNDGLSFYCTSFPQPDKLLHGLGEGHCSEEFFLSESNYMDKVIARIDEYCNEHGITYLIFGDHGAPGANPPFGRFYDQKIAVVRHRKHSMIISNYKKQIPQYTDEIFPWILKFFNIKRGGLDG